MGACAVPGMMDEGMGVIIAGWGGGAGCQLGAGMA